MWADSWAPTGGVGRVQERPPGGLGPGWWSRQQGGPKPKGSEGLEAQVWRAVTAVLGGAGGQRERAGEGHRRGQGRRPRAGGRGGGAKAARERRTVQWGSSLQAEGSRVLTPSALHLRGPNTLGNSISGTRIRPALDRLGSVPPNHPEEKGTRAGRSRLQSHPRPRCQEEEGQVLGGLGQQAGGATLACGPPVPGQRPVTQAGAGLPCLSPPSGFRGCSCPRPAWDSSPAALAHPLGAWLGVPHGGAPPVLPALTLWFPPRFTEPAARCPRRLCRLHTAGCPVRPGCSAMPGPSQASCPQAPDCRPLGSSTW